MSVLVAELGDKTQIATLLFAANPEAGKLGVFLAQLSPACPATKHSLHFPADEQSTGQRRGELLGTRGPPRKEPEMKWIHRIMHASDFSPASRPAFRKAIELAKLARAPLLVVHARPPVISPLMGEGAYVSPATWNAIEASAQKAAQGQLARLLREAKRAGIHATGLVVEGTPADRIVRVARARRVDLLVLGTHGRTGFSRLVLGGVAARVVATAHCPVLTVRARR